LRSAFVSPSFLGVSFANVETHFPNALPPAPRPLQVLAGLLASFLAPGVSVLAAGFDGLGDKAPATETAGTHKTAVATMRSRTFLIL
jgi:hypothetical protein